MHFLKIFQTEAVIQILIPSRSQKLLYRGYQSVDLGVFVMFEQNYQRPTNLHVYQYLTKHTLGSFGALKEIYLLDKYSKVTLFLIHLYQMV